MEPPPAGCSTEDLRLYVLQVVKQQDAHARDTTDLEMRIAVQLNGITRDIGELGKESQAVKRDVGVFEAIKHLVTESALDARTAAIYEDLKVLTLKTQSFAEHLEGYLQRTDIMEKTFQGHIATAFAKVESEFAEIKNVVEGVHNAGADAGNAASMATLQIQQASLHQRTARIEAEHVAVKSELIETQQGSGVLTARIQAVVASMDAAVAAAVHNAAAVQVSQGPGIPVPCHCVHVDQLDTRVQQIEALMAARPTAGPGVQDPWAAGAAAAAAASSAAGMLPQTML
jgi:hypothetical protein